MSTPLQGNGRLDGWKAISDHLGWHVRTVMRWEQQRGLPIHRVPGGQRHAVFAFRQELDEWLKNGHFDQDDIVVGPEFSPCATVRGHLVYECPTIETTNSVGLPGPMATHFRLRTSRRAPFWISVGTILLALAAYTVHSLAFPSRIEFTHLIQLTNDGALKEGLVTDGKTVYFGENLGSRVVLATVPAEGGPVRLVSTPFDQVVPADISPDGKKLLVLVRKGRETERALWIVPASGGQPKQVGTVNCHAAAWAPDGHRIAIAAQNSIYITADEDSSIHQIQSFDTIPESIRWSPDGKRLRFNLRDEKTWTSSFWELTFGDHDKTQVASLVPLHVVLTNCWARSLTLDVSGRSFVGQGECGNERIGLIEGRHEPWNPGFELLTTNAMVHHTMNLALDPGSKELFVLGDVAVPQKTGLTERLDLLRFDMHSHETSPFLPGISATDVDFSRDGRLIAYVRRPDQTLWMSQSDGTSARRVEISANYLELPRWSPDGKWLAFMAQLPGKPWRIFLVPSAGGKPQEASAGTASLGAPTWSPDGKWLVYGNVECQEAGTCAIHRLNISTGREFSVPGSEGLGTARWSPDGKFIAALNPMSHEALVFELATQRWRHLIDGVNGNDLSWSPDSRFLYANRPYGDQPEILRVSLENAKVEAVVDLRAFTAQTGHINTWFALAPDGSIVFMREISGNELFALAYSEK
jgi:Tol biopolymer transport system component